MHPSSVQQSKNLMRCDCGEGPPADDLPAKFEPNICCCCCCSCSSAEGAASEDPKGWVVSDDDDEGGAALEIPVTRAVASMFWT